MVSKITKITLKGTTDASGDLTVYSNPVRGNVKCVHLDLSGLDATADTTMTTDGELVAQTIAATTNSQTDTVIYPRTSAEDNAGTDLLHAAAGTIVPVEYTVFGRLKVVVAQGGATKAFKAHVLVEEY